MEAAIAARAIVRTWPMRGTLHFVPGEDARWMLRLLSPRVVARSSGRHRQLGLAEADFTRARKVLERALRDGRPSLAAANVRRAPAWRRVTRGPAGHSHHRAPGPAAVDLPWAAAGTTADVRPAGRLGPPRARPAARGGPGHAGLALLRQPRPGHAARLRLVVRPADRRGPPGDGRRRIQARQGPARGGARTGGGAAPALGRIRGRVQGPHARAGRPGRRRSRPRNGDRPAPDRDRRTRRAGPGAGRSPRPPSASGSTGGGRRARPSGGRWTARRGAMPPSSARRRADRATIRVLFRGGGSRHDEPPYRRGRAVAGRRRSFESGAGAAEGGGHARLRSATSRSTTSSA